MNITRLDNNGQRFDVDETGSNYINHLHDTVEDLVHVLKKVQHFWETGGDAKARYAHEVRAALAKAKA